MDSERFKYDFGFTDLLFGTVFIIMALFILVLLLINEDNNKEITLQAAIVIIATWDPTHDTDIDLWLQDPTSGISYWREKEVGLMHLDRDDIGRGRDYIKLEGIDTLVPINQEIMKIRKTIPGKYIVNLHYFESNLRTPETVTVQIIQISPVYKLLAVQTAVLIRYQEKTVFTFITDKEGKVIELNGKEQISIIGNKLLSREVVPAQ